MPPRTHTNIAVYGYAASCLPEHEMQATSAGAPRSSPPPPHPTTPTEGMSQGHRQWWFSYAWVEAQISSVWVSGCLVSWQVQEGKMWPWNTEGRNGVRMALLGLRERGQGQIYYSVCFSVCFWSLWVSFCCEQCLVSTSPVGCSGCQAFGKKGVCVTNRVANLQARAGDLPESQQISR